MMSWLNCVSIQERSRTRLGGGGGGGGGVVSYPDPDYHS